MIIGIALAITLSIFLTSLVLITTGLTRSLQENYLTGAVIGTTEVVSYSTVFFIISLMVLLILINYMKNKKKY